LAGVAYVTAEIISLGILGVFYFSDSFSAAKYERTCCICGCAIDKITWTAALFGVVVNVANA